MSKINVEHIRLLDLDLMENTSVTVIGDLMKLTPLLRTRTEYEKVTESIFDLRDEFERGGLYSYYMNGKHTKVTNEDDLLENYKDKNLYRKVEKDIDWRDEVHECLSGIGYHWATPIAEVINDDESDYFLELCRVALRANGEIE